MGAYLSLTITDLPDPGPAPALAGSPLGAAVRTVWCHLPADWVVDGELRPCRRRILLNGLRQPTGAGDEPDRSPPLVVRERVLSAREARDRPWLRDRAGFLRYAPDGSHRSVTAVEL